MGVCGSGRARPYPEVIMGRAPESRLPATSHCVTAVGASMFLTLERLLARGQALDKILSSLASCFPCRSEWGSCSE